MVSLVAPTSAQDARRAADLARLAEVRARLVRQIVDLDSMIRRIWRALRYVSDGAWACCRAANGAAMMLDEDVRGIRARLRWAIWRARRGGVGLLELERRAGLSRGELRQIQRKGCARVPVAKFRRIAEVLGVRVSWLVLGDGPAWWEVRVKGTPPDDFWRFVEHAAARRERDDSTTDDPRKHFVVIALRPPWRRRGPAPQGFAPRREPSPPECLPGVRCDAVPGCVMAKHHEPPCRVEEASPCGECGRWPWEACDADA